MLAAFTRQPDLELTEEESKKLATAITRVVEQYELPLLDERSLAWIGLGMAGVQVYGTRLASAVLRAKRGPQVVPAKQPSSVQNTPPAAPVIIDQAFQGAPA